MAASDSANETIAFADTDDDLFERIQIEEAMRRSLQDQEAPAASPPPHDESVTSNLLYEAAHVSVDTRPNSKRGRIPGELRVIKQGDSCYLMWQPSVRKVGAIVTSSYAVNQALDDIKKLMIRRNNHLIISLKEGTTLLPLFFESGTIELRTFLGYLSKHGFNASAQSPNVYTKSPPQHLVRSLEGLGMSVGQAAQEARWSLFERFAKVTKFARENIAEYSMGGKAQDAHPAPLQHLHDEAVGPMDSNGASAVSETEDSSPDTPTTKAHKDIQCRQKTDLGDLGTFDVIQTARPIGPVPCTYRGDPMTQEDLSRFFDEDNTLHNEPTLRRCLFRQGASPEIRPQVWRVLLNHFCNDGPEASAEFLQERRDEYFVYKQQWTTMTPQQLAHNDHWRDVQNRIKKDVDRTDRTVDMFSSDNSPMLKRLSDVLTTYCVFNADLGYVQGMSDLLAVVLRVVEDEVDSFWCFSNLMDQKKFQLDQREMSKNLEDLSSLCRFLDPEFMEYLEQNDSANFFFAFRWLLINFKREFEFNDICLLWESIWSNHMTDRFEIFICLATLELNKTTIIEQQLGFDEILRFVNELSCTLDVGEVISKAEELCYRLAMCHEYLPEGLQHLLVI